MNVCMITAENASFFQHFMDRERSSDVLSYGLIAQGVACGCAQVILQREHGTLCHIFVAPTFRRLGGGTLLLETIAQQLRRHGVRGITASMPYLTYSDMAYLGYFFMQCHWIEGPITSWRYTFPLAPVCVKHARDPVEEKNLIPMSKTTPSQQEGLLNTLSNPEAKEEFQGILNLPDLCPQASVLVLGQERLDGYFMVRHWDHQMEVVGLRYMGKDAAPLYAMIGACLAWAEPVVPADTMVDMLITNEKVQVLAQRMLAPVSHSVTPVHHFALKF